MATSGKIRRVNADEMTDFIEVKKNNKARVLYVDKKEFLPVLESKSQMLDTFVYKNYYIPEAMAEGFLVVGERKTDKRDDAGFIIKEEYSEIYVTPMWENVGLKSSKTVVFESADKAFKQWCKCKDERHQVRNIMNPGHIRCGWVCADCGAWYQVKKSDFNALRNCYWFNSQVTIESNISLESFAKNIKTLNYFVEGCDVVEFDTISEMSKSWVQCVKDLHVVYIIGGKNNLRLEYKCEDCNKIYRLSNRDLEYRLFLRFMLKGEKLENIIYDLRKGQDFVDVVQRADETPGDNLVEPGGIFTVPEENMFNEDNAEMKKLMNEMVKYEDVYIQDAVDFLKQWEHCSCNHLARLKHLSNGVVTGWTCFECKKNYKMAYSKISEIKDMIDSFNALLSSSYDKNDPLAAELMSGGFFNFTTAETKAADSFGDQRQSRRNAFDLNFGRDSG